MGCKQLKHTERTYHSRSIGMHESVTIQHWKCLKGTKFGLQLRNRPVISFEGERVAKPMEGALISLQHTISPLVLRTRSQIFQDFFSRFFTFHFHRAFNKKFILFTLITNNFQFLSNSLVINLNVQTFGFIIIFCLNNQRNCCLNQQKLSSA